MSLSTETIWRLTSGRYRQAGHVHLLLTFPLPSDESEPDQPDLASSKLWFALVLVVSELTGTQDFFPVRFSADDDVIGGVEGKDLKN